MIVTHHDEGGDYRRLCESDPSIPVFAQAWWLDAVAPQQWSVVLACHKEQVVGALPYVKLKRLGRTLLTQPQLTQTLGPWIRPSKKSYPKRLAYEKDILYALADGLPGFDRYVQNWHPSIQNWLPFYWRGFEQTTRYTYRLDCSVGEDALWNGLQQNIRGDIRKARDRFGVKVRDANDLDEFLRVNALTFKRQGRDLPYSRDLVARIDEAASARNARDCLVAEDAEGQRHAVAFIVRGTDTAYYLMGGGDPALRNSGATSLLLWEAIRRQPDTVRHFDFEGSMIERIERFFRAFGARQTPYFRVSKYGSRWFALAAGVRQSLRG